MERFLTPFPVGLCAFFAVLFFVLFSILFGQGPWRIPVFSLTGGIAIVRLILGPLIARHLRAHTVRALDTLLANMVAVGDSG
jgi:hypothetical protein